MLEFAATADPAAGGSSCSEHRAGIELLGSRWTSRLALRATSCRRCARPAVAARDERVAVARLAPRDRRPRRSGSNRSVRPSYGRGTAETDDTCCGWSCPTSASRSSSWSRSGATATTSSAGPPARPSCTSRGCCASAARCSTSASSPRSRPRHRPGSPEVLDRGRRHLRGRLPRLAVGVGAVAGFRTVVGLAILIYRRRTVGPVFSSDDEERQDDVRLPCRRSILLGLATTVAQRTSSATTTTATGCRSGSADLPAHPQPELMAEAPLASSCTCSRRLAAVRALAVHPARARVQRPVGYLTRPYVVYRSRDDGSVTARRAGMGPGRGEDSGRRRPAWTPWPVSKLERATASGSPRSAETVYGGHENSLRRTVIALSAGAEPLSMRTQARRRSWSFRYASSWSPVTCPAPGGPETHRCAGPSAQLPAIEDSPCF